MPSKLSSYLVICTFLLNTSLASAEDLGDGDQYAAGTPYGKTSTEMQANEPEAALPMDPSTASGINMASMSQPGSTASSQTASTSNAAPDPNSIVQDGPDVTSQPAGTTVTGTAPNITTTTVTYAGNWKYVNTTSVAEVTTPQGLSNSTTQIQESYEWNSQTRAWVLNNKSGSRIDSITWNVVSSPNDSEEGSETTNYSLNWTVDASGNATAGAPRETTFEVSTTKKERGVTMFEENWVESVSENGDRRRVGYENSFTKAAVPGAPFTEISSYIKWFSDGSRNETNMHKTILRNPLDREERMDSSTYDANGDIAGSTNSHYISTHGTFKNQPVELFYSILNESLDKDGNVTTRLRYDRFLDKDDGVIQYAKEMFNFGMEIKIFATIDWKTGYLLRMSRSTYTNNIITHDIIWNSGDLWDPRLTPAFQELTGMNSPKLNHPPIY